MRKECDYDIRRKTETEETLRTAISRMKATKKYRNKPISVYALSKETGVARTSIMRFPSVIEILNKTKIPSVKFKNAHVKTGKIRNFDDAIAVVETLEKLYNETADKANILMAENIKLNSEIVKLQDERAELRQQLSKMCRNEV